MLKFTRYFQDIRERIDRVSIQDAWIAETIENPLRREKQPDGRIRLWRYIDDVDRYLRVILLEDEATVHNAFFDRRFKEYKGED